MANAITPPLKTPLPKLTADSLTDDISIEELEKFSRIYALKQALRAEEEIQEKREETLRARLAGITSTKMEMEKHARDQEYCDHRKPNGQSHLAGQRNHFGVAMLICQRCQKAWHGLETVPAGLGIPSEWIGGPQF